MDSLRDAVDVSLGSFQWFVLVYFLVLNTIYLVLTVIAAVDLAGYFRRRMFSGDDVVFANPMTMPVSVIVPAHNEEAGIVDSVRAMMALRYPDHEVVIVEDGSTDATFPRLKAAFDLVEVPLVIPDLVPTRGRILSTHVPRDGASLVVVRKETAGSKADANNVGINAASHPLVCMVDADAVLEEDALLRVTKPFVDDPIRTVATGGTIRVINGSRVEHGRLADPRLPRSWLARIQVVEYLRSFLLGRAGWSRLQGLLIISGAFGVFRRDLMVEIGGYDLDSVAEDADVVARIHRLLRQRKTEYRITFVTEPVCWTEVPETMQTLGRQRRRWSRGLADLLWRYRAMIANPRYGRVGTVTMPYFLVFESLGPTIELVGVASVIVGLALGLVDVPFALLFAAVAVGYGLALSLAALALEELSYRRYRRARDLAAMGAAAVLENVGYRQLHAWWRLQGLVASVRRREAVWEPMVRVGFGAGAAVDVDTRDELDGGRDILGR
jgi:cellulose synthase/poly-beta-1,6-N-acetylglucosamine synthase-like glycosyltransferase